MLATPLHHPVRLAEDAIMFDWITRGRLVLGLGIAHQVPDFKAFGVPRDERIEVFEEVLDLLELCFAGEPYRYEGKHFTSEAHITPRPFTLPRPEIWIGAHSQSGLERAARRADLWLADPQRDVQTIAKLAVTYRRHAEELGKTAARRHLPRGVDRRQQGRVRAGLVGQPAAGAPALLQRRHVQEALRAVGRRGRRAGELHHRPARARDASCTGAPRTMRAEVEEWRELTGCEYLALRFRHPGGPSHAETMEALRRFGAEVIMPLTAETTTTGARP